MAWWRGSVLVLCLAAIALGLVILRGEQARSAAHALALEGRYVECRRRLWDVEASVARLRTPDRIHRHLSRLNYFVSPSWLNERPGPADRLALIPPSE